MAEQFYTILTAIGKAKIANSAALGEKVELTHLALGDGGGSYYNPTEDQTALRNEVWRGAISTVDIDAENSNWIAIQTVVPSQHGGFMIREAGVFDDEGDLIAVGKYPETYKPLAADGSIKDLVVRMILEVGNTSSVQLKVDPTIVLATKKDINDLAGAGRTTQTVKGNADSIAALQQAFASHLADKAAHMSDAEKNYWRDQAALLDPKAYEFVTGSQIPDWSITVPQGETWYSLNLWNVVINGVTFYHRVNDARRPLLLPSGTTLSQLSGSNASYAYLCKPSLVMNDPRYQNDPKGLYFSRLHRLRNLALHALSVQIPSGSGLGLNVTEDFPEDFEDGLVVHVSQHDISWLGLSMLSATLNTLNEISDDHQQRVAESVFIPFRRSIFPFIRARAASVLGQQSEFSSLAGTGAVLYYKLPSDW